MTSMSKYKCKECDKEFKKKNHYDNHLNRKNKCYENESEEKKKLECIYCDKLFSRHDSMMRHIKNSCKVFKKVEEDKEQIFVELKN